MIADNNDDLNMIDPAMMLVVGSNDRTLGSAGDTSVPDPLHPQCTITFHCDLHGQHCTSTSSCDAHGLKAAQFMGAGAVRYLKAPDGSNWICEPQECKWNAFKGVFECAPPVCRPA